MEDAGPGRPDAEDFAALCAQAQKALEIARLARAEAARDLDALRTPREDSSKALAVSRGLAEKLDAVLGALLARMEPEDRAGCGGSA